MKSLKRMSLVLLATLMLVSLVACKNKSIVGTWQSENSADSIDYTFVFEKDNTGSLSISGVTIPFEYKVKKDEITLTMTLLGTTEDDKYTYKLSDKKLTLTDDKDFTIELIKQK